MKKNLQTPCKKISKGGRVYLIAYTLVWGGREGAIGISYRMVLSAIWDIFFEFFLFPTYCTSRRRVQYRKQNEREKYIPYCTKLPCDNWFIVR